MAVSRVYMICHAYEAGVGKGRDGQDVPNPYPTNAPLSAELHEAWGYGYDEGRQQAEEAARTFECETCHDGIDACEGEECRDCGRIGAPYPPLPSPTPSHTGEQS